MLLLLLKKVLEKARPGIGIALYVDLHAITCEILQRGPRCERTRMSEFSELHSRIGYRVARVFKATCNDRIAGESYHVSHYLFHI